MIGDGKKEENVNKVAYPNALFSCSDAMLERTCFWFMTFGCEGEFEKACTPSSINHSY